MLPPAVRWRLGARRACRSLNERRDGRWQSAQRSSREHRAGSGWRSPGCSARRATASRWPRGGRRSSRPPSQGLAADGFDVQAVAANVADEAEIQKVVAAHRERYGRLDVLVNNAGVGIGATRRRDRDQAPGHAARHQPALDHPLLPRMHGDAARGRRPSTRTRSSSTPPRSPASTARAGCRSTRPPSTASSAGPKR